MSWFGELVGGGARGMLATATPYVVVALGLAVVAAGGAAYVLSLRLELAQAAVTRVEGERDSARAAAKAARAQSAAAAAAAAKRLKDEIAARAKADTALAEYRKTEKGETNACHFAVVDPSVDRLLERARAGGSPVH